MNLTVKTTVDVPMPRIASVICTGFEGGIGYWASIERYTCAPGTTLYTDADDNYCPHYVSHALSDGASVTLIEDSGNGDKPRKRTLTLAKVKRGLALMAKQEPSHFADVVSGRFDATTGDVFLQLCLLGEVEYE